MKHRRSFAAALNAPQKPQVKVGGWIKITTTNSRTFEGKVYTYCPDTHTLVIHILFILYLIDSNDSFNSTAPHQSILCPPSSRHPSLQFLFSVPPRHFLH